MNLLSDLTKRLHEHSNSPLADAVEIIRYVFGANADNVIGLVSEPNTEELSEINHIVQQLASGKPLALILGYTNFYGYKILVNSSTIIPRIETEGLVEQALNVINSSISSRPVRVAELCVGSGCIGATLLAELTKKNIKAAYRGIELNPDAAKLAIANFAALDNLSGEAIPAEQHRHLKAEPMVSILVGNVLTDDISHYFANDIMIANPPYLTSSEINSLEKSVSDFEPKLALDGGSDGLLFYKRISGELAKVSNRPVLLLEISPATAGSCLELFGALYGQVVVEEDLFGRARYLVCKPTLV